MTSKKLADLSSNLCRLWKASLKKRATRQSAQVSVPNTSNTLSLGQQKPIRARNSNWEKHVLERLCLSYKSTYLKISFTIQFALYVVFKYQLGQLTELASFGVYVPEQDQQVHGYSPSVRGVVDVALSKMSGKESLFIRLIYHW